MDTHWLIFSGVREEPRWIPLSINNISENVQMLFFFHLSVKRAEGKNMKHVCDRKALHGIFDCEWLSLPLSGSLSPSPLPFFLSLLSPLPCLSLYLSITSSSLSFSLSFFLFASTFSELCRQLPTASLTSSRVASSTEETTRTATLTWSSDELSRMCGRAPPKKFQLPFTVVPPTAFIFLTVGSATLTAYCTCYAATNEENKSIFHVIHHLHDHCTTAEMKKYIYIKIATEVLAQTLLIGWYYWYIHIHITVTLRYRHGLLSLPHLVLRKHSKINNTSVQSYTLSAVA